MSAWLEELADLLRRGQQLSKMTSLERTLPVPKSRPDLFAAQTGLRAYTSENPNDEQGWRLLALAEECVTNFKAAIRCLEQAMAIAGTRSKKDLKTLARLRAYAANPPRKHRS